MLRRWDTLIYDVELILKFLHVILESLKIDDRFQKRKGRRPKRLPSLYVKAIVLKEIFKCSLRYSESLAGDSSKSEYQNPRSITGKQGTRI